jgi:hypothetical protein
LLLSEAILLLPLQEAKNHGALCLREQTHASQIITTKLSRRTFGQTKDRFRSFSGDDWYTISIHQKTCDCPNFQTKADGCEHLTALGIHRLRPFAPTTHPTFSQTLSGLVKSIRIRRVEDAVYGLVYLDTFKGAQYRFRTTRRLLIGSAEGGHSVAVMEKVSGILEAQQAAERAELIWWPRRSKLTSVVTPGRSASALGMNSV